MAIELIIPILIIILLPCWLIYNISKNKKYYDGNQGIQENYLIDNEYEKTGKAYPVFIYNTTDSIISTDRSITIKPNEHKMFELTDSESIHLNIGVVFILNEMEGLEIVDKKSQVSGLGGSFLDKYNVPDSAEYAFIIVNPGEGD